MCPGRDERPQTTAEDWHMAGERELIERIFDEVVNKRNVDAVDEYFTEDYVDHGPGMVLHGRNAFKEFTKVWLGAFSELRAEVTDVAIDGDKAGWLVHVTGRHTGDGLG